MKPKHFKRHALYQSLALVVLAPVAATQGHAEDNVQQLSTIMVHANDVSKERYVAKIVDLTGFGTQQLAQIPASVSVITAERIADQHAKLLTDVVKNDASMGDGYAPIGYYPNFVSRGFSLDLASSYLINGNLVRGEQNIALENKERVEILKGISAIQSDMSTPGGVVNFVTKRPKDIHTIGLDVDSYGDNTISADLGGFVGAQKQFGYRVNIAQEKIHPYVEHTNGQRTFGSVALDWNVSDHSQLQFDLESQRQRQRSVPGYQLLDGQTVPIDVSWKRLLGYQSWGKPVTINSLNTSLKYNYMFNDDWTASLSASHSKAKIDDYSAFPYGYYADGTYDLYDYQSPDDARNTDQYKAVVKGHFSTGKLEHHVMLGLTQTNKTQKQYEGVNTNLDANGNPMSGSIYTDTPDYQTADNDLGSYYKSLDSKQTALSIQDQIQLNTQWSTLLGGKWVHVNEKAYDKDSIQTRKTQMDKFLPQVALMYRPVDNTNLYVSYAKGLADGGQAPWYTRNANEVLAPIQSEQYEVGIKQQIQKFLVTAAVYDLTQDNQYSSSLADGEQIFIAQGKQRNRGVELSVNGDLTEQWSITSSAAWIRSRLTGIDRAAFAGHQTQNSPKFRIATHLSYAVPEIEGLRVLGGFQYSARKFANKEGSVSVPSYTIFDAGVAYNFKLYGYDTALRFNVDNVFNKKYWRDAGGYLGDDYLFLGAPRTAQLSLKFNF